MNNKSQIIIVVLTIASMPAFSCSNHPPQKASVAPAAAVTSESASSSSTTPMTVAKKIPVAGPQSFTKDFFGSEEPKANPSDEWNSAIE